MKTMEQTIDKTAQNENQPFYSAEEFAASHAVFGTSEDLIRAAFRFSGKERAAQKEALKIVNTFKEMEA